MQDNEPIPSTSHGVYGERAQSPSQELAHESSSVRLGKRKLSETVETPSSSASSPAPSAALLQEPSIDRSTPIVPQYPSIAPLPLFAPAPATLVSLFDSDEDPEFEFFATRSHPFNKHGFRYTPCGPSLQSPLPVPPQRIIESEPRSVRFSWEDRSVFTYITRDAKTVTTDKGWRGVRCNVGVREGDWFWEFQIERAGGQGGRNEGRGDGQGSWVRVGVGRRESGLNAPVGVDGYSYGIRDKTGDKVHQSHTTSYGKPFKSGTTVGVYLSLPPRTTTDDTATTTTDNNPSSSSARDPRRIMRKRVPILYKNQLYFEQLEYTSSKEMDELLVDPILKQKQLKAQEEEAKKKKNKKNPGTRIHDGDSNSGSNKNQNLPPMRDLPIIPRSKLGFWIDGEFQGKAFENLFDFIPLMKHAKKEHQKKEKTNRLVTENHHDDGTTGYYPFVSVFGGGTVTLNSGEQGFKFPPSRQDIASLLDDEEQQDKEEEGRTSVRWKPLCERYQEFYTEQTRLDDLDELEQIKLLVDVRAKELARLQRQAEKAERAAVAAAAGAGEGGGGGGVSKKAKTSSSSISYSNEIGVGMGMGNAIALTQYQNQIVGTAKGQEESPVNSPKPVASFSEDAIKSEGM